MTVGFWHIWEARNDARNTDAKPDPVRTCFWHILAYIDLIRSTLLEPAPDIRREPVVSTPEGIPPPPGTCMIYSDAAIFQALDRMGAGVIIRHHDGGFRAACRSQLSGLAAPEDAEALALRRAVSFARDEGVDRAIFATDCLSLVQRLHSSPLDRSVVGMVVGDIKLLASEFSSVSFTHVKRSLNEAAHVLANSCSSVISSDIFHSAPEFIERTLCIDVV